MANYPFKINGYIYSPGTKKGFLRMQRQGIPRPMFAIQDRLAKTLNKRYRSLIRLLLKELKAKLNESDIVLDKAPDDDSIESLLSYFEEMGKQTQAENQKIADKSNLYSIANSLEREWFSDTKPDSSAWEIVNRVFKLNQADYLKRLYSDADGQFRNKLLSLSIDKKQFFNDNMENVRRLYVDNSLERIQGEEELIKRKILKRITDYALNKSDTLRLDDLTKEAFEQGDHLSHLFARDQLQRFNKACTISTFINAGVTKVKWVTSHDIRVRKSHKELDGKVFYINELPQEVNDFNCRCSLVPVEWED